MQTTSVPHHHDPHPENEQYSVFLVRLRHRFGLMSREALFTTDVQGLFDAFLSQLPESRRQHYRCRACQHFIERFGGLVTIEPDGLVTSAVWNIDDTPPFFETSVRAMMALIQRAKVDGVFLSREETLGYPMTPSIKGPWYHLHGLVAEERLYRGKLLTPFQAMAEKGQDHYTVARALREYSMETLDKALHLLRSEQLYRAEKVIGPAEWLAKLHEVRARTQPSLRDNVLWRAVADAPAGFCHPRSSMIGTLLDDIAAGLPFAAVSKKFAEKMHPLQYQRPQAAPALGTIREAEKVFEKLGLEPALGRRYAKLEEIETIWAPKPPRMVPRRGGVFGDVKAKGEVEKKTSKLVAPRITMTWEKFQRTVLPTAEALEFYTDHRVSSYTGYVTAVNPDAPPILQWDREDKRNPVSWYFWHEGSLASNWNLPPGQWVKVTGVSFKPNMWADPPLPQHGEGVLFVLEGAYDHRQPSLCLFPEILRSELHGVRSVIEAHSKSRTIEGRTAATACGVMLQKGSSPWRFVFRVNGEQEYLLDRWD